MIRSVGVDELWSLAPENSVWITDSNLIQHYPQVPRPIVVPAGETSKSLAMFGQVQSQIAQIGLTRKGGIVAFGGGVVGDLAGFVAATYMRGVSLVQIPTTLLAMVDSAVGGKVGIDLPEGKNLVGAFSPPGEVFIAPELLVTLPDREFTNGMAEVVKYGFIRDRALVESLDRTIPTVGSPELENLIWRCIRHKAEVVEADEFETNGLRATLNFGHTIGHAIERELGYQGLLHGEAISIGMALEARLGERIGFTNAGTAGQVQRLLLKIGLPTELPSGLTAESLVRAIRMDKKNVGTDLAFAMLESMGECKLITNVPEHAVEAFLNDCR